MKRLQRTPFYSLILAVVIAMCGFGASGASAATPVSVATAVSLSNAAPQAGQPFNVTMSYSCSSVVVDCLGAGVVLNIPAGLDAPSGVIGSIHVASWAYNPASRNIRFTFVNPLPAGSTGQVQFTTAFTSGPTANGDTADFVAQMYTTNAGTFTSASVRATASAASSWTITTSVVTQGPIDSDTIFKIYVCDATSTTFGRTNLVDETFVDTLPTGAVFVAATNGGLYNPTTGNVVWHLTAIVAPGGCMPSVRVTMNFPNAAFNSGDVVVHTVTGHGHIPGATVPKAVTFNPGSVSILLTGPKPIITATKTTTTTNLVPGDTVPYVFSLTNSGNVPLTSVSFSDVFPQGMSILPGGRVGIGNTAGGPVNIYYSTARTPRTVASFALLGAGAMLGTSTSGSYTTAPNPLPGSATGITGVHYSYLNTLNVGQTVSVEIDVVYNDIDDAGNPIPPTTALNNCGIVRWYYNGVLHSSSPCANRTVPTPSPDVRLTMTNCCSTPAPGQTVPWDFTATNNGNVHVANTIVNTFPDGNVVAAGAQIGTVSLGAAVANQVDVYYSTATAPRTTPSWTPLTSALLGANKSVTLTAPATLVGGGAITALKYVFLHPQRVGEMLSARTYLLFTNAYDDGSPIATRSTLSNCATSTYSFRAITLSKTVCGSLLVPAPWLNVLATNAGGLASYPAVPLGGTLTLPLQMNNTNSSWYSVTDPIVAEVVPFELAPNGVSWGASFVIVNQPGLTFNVATDFITKALPGGRTALRWKFHGNLVPNTTIRIDLTGVAQQTLWNTQVHQNLHTGGSAPVSPVCAPGVSALGIAADPEDVVGRGVSAQGCNARWGHVLTASAALNSALSVKGALDAGYVRYPTQGQSFAGGQGDWRLAISNAGTVPVGSVVVVDKLPTVGDTAVLSTASRGSQFSLNLAGAVIPSDPAIKVYYSVATNPCRQAELGVVVAGCTPALWMPVIPTDPTVIRSIKFDFTTLVLQPGAVFTLDWPMRVPTGTPPAKTAFDSVAFTGTRTDTNSRLLAAEPNMTGLHVNPAPPNIFGGTAWSDANNNGLQDAGEGGVNGVRVNLYTAAGALVGTTISATDYLGNPGTYSFGNLGDGDYYAVFDVTSIPLFATVSPQNVGLDDTIDSDADPVTGQTATYTLTGLVANTTIDIGVHLSGCDTTTC